MEMNRRVGERSGNIQIGQNDARAAVKGTDQPHDMHGADGFMVSLTERLIA